VIVADVEKEAPRIIMKDAEKKGKGYSWWLQMQRTHDAKQQHPLVIKSSWKTYLGGMK